MQWKDKFHAAMSKIGPDGKTGYQRRGEKIRAVKLAKDPNYFAGWSEKVIATMKAEGTLQTRQDRVRAARLAKINEDERQELKRYRSRVGYLSRKQDLSDLPNYGVHDFQMDHKFSIIEGFRQGVSPEILAHKSNLQFIHRRENRAKSGDCCITLEQLMVNL